MATLTPLEHTAIGAFSGMLEVCVMQPSIGVKNAVQQGLPIPWRTPLVLYRGLLVGFNLLIHCPCTSSNLCITSI